MISSSQVGRSTFWTACGNFLFSGTDGSCGADAVTEGGRDTCFGFTCTGPVGGAGGSGAEEVPEVVEASDNAAVDPPVWSFARRLERIWGHVLVDSSDISTTYTVGITLRVVHGG